MAKEKLSAGVHIISENKRKGTKMVVTIYKLANGKCKSYTTHVHD